MTFRFFVVIKTLKDRAQNHEQCLENNRQITFEFPFFSYACGGRLKRIYFSENK